MSATESSPGITEVNCPTCGKRVAWIESNRFRPFCSKKCQLIDFGDWASERNSIPAEEPPDDMGLEDPFNDEQR